MHRVMQEPEPFTGSKLLSKRPCKQLNKPAQLQAHFQRDRDQMSREEEEEYEQACEDSMFRIHILDKRLKRHEEAALQSYYELDNKLRHDPRLAVLML